MRKGTAKSFEVYERNMENLQGSCNKVWWRWAHTLQQSAEGQATSKCSPPPAKQLEHSPMRVIRSNLDNHSQLKKNGNRHEKRRDWSPEVYERNMEYLQGSCNKVWWRWSHTLQQSVEGQANSKCVPPAKQLERSPILDIHSQSKNFSQEYNLWFSDPQQ